MVFPGGTFMKFGVVEDFSKMPRENSSLVKI
jgi:hypothetical protein